MLVERTQKSQTNESEYLIKKKTTTWNRNICKKKTTITIKAKRIRHAALVKFGRFITLPDAFLLT